jgi:hypothetical protein
MEGTAGGLGYEATGVSIAVDGNRVHAELRVGKAAADRTEPEVVGLSRFGRTATWKFDLSESVRS